MNLIALPSGIETVGFDLREGALTDLPEFLEQFFAGRPAWLVADDNTWRAAGAQVQEILTAAGTPCLTPVILPGTPRLHPDYQIVKDLAEQMPGECVPVAVGSGVINDLVKCAASLRNVTYLCVPTAASVDGYTAYGGAMQVDGEKKTVPCPAPYGIVADTAILAAAPAEMLSSGYADLLTKNPAGGDWLIAATLNIEPVKNVVWNIVQKELPLWISDPSNLEHIFAGLAATGYAMQMYRDSRPASGAEHLFSHVWEMEHLQYNGEEVSHGFKVGIGLLASLRLMEFVTAHSYEEVAPLARPLQSVVEREAEIDGLLQLGCYGTAKSVAMAKFLSGQEGEERRRQIGRCWEEIREKLAGQLLSSAQAEALLLKANCPVKPEEIGLKQEQYLHGIRTAQLIRKRYTILDFLYEAGLLDAAIAERL